MKYLKLYEELGNEVLFSEITDDEWDDNFLYFYGYYSPRSDCSYEDFSLREVNLLNQYFNIDSKSEWYVLGPYGKSLKGYPDCKGLCILDFTRPMGFCIIKSIDEWYYVGDFQNRRSYKYYKCDTFDGLMQCLNHCRF